MNNPLNTDAAPEAPQSDLMLVNGRSFTVADTDGSLRSPRHGLVFEDVRILSRFHWEISDATGVRRRRLLSSTQPVPFAAVNVFDLSQHDGSGVVTDDIVVHRQWVGRGARHRLEYRNLTDQHQFRTLNISVTADFAHIFDMKERKAPGPDAQVLIDEGAVRLASSETHATLIRFTPQPEANAETLAWHIDAPPDSTWILDVEIEPEVDGQAAGMAFPDGPPQIAAATARTSQPHIETTDSRIEAAFQRAVTDIAALRIYDPYNPANVVVAAGAPWFMTLFGRDSLLTSLMGLPWMPDLAVGVARALAQLQGTETNPTTEEAPGKIIHELRRSSGASAFGERGRYYGTVDATPLFVMLVAQLHENSLLTQADIDFLNPALSSALNWVCDAIETGPDGFIAYKRTTDAGLINQGWKDSWDGVSSQDGTLPAGPVALAEVQGYAFAALTAATNLPDAGAGERRSRDELTAIAVSLQERYNHAFWSTAEGHYITGFSASGVLDSLTTNPGHAIWCGIADHDKANQHLDRCMEPDLFTGWGLRTLSTTAALYNPLSYHNGSVWPHDTALVAAGADRIGRSDIADRLADAAFETASLFEGRPPELFAGFDRSEIETPVPYPSSCSPQAWSSASILSHLRSALHLDVDGTINRTDNPLGVSSVQVASRPR